MGGPGSGRRRNAARWRKAVELRGRGLSLPQIGRRLGISHQGARHIIVSSMAAGAPLAVRCAECGAKVAEPAEGPYPGAAYCRRCLAARPDVPLAIRLRSLRLVAGLTRLALARRAGVTLHIIGQIERGQCAGPDGPNARALIKALGVELVPGERLDFPPCHEAEAGAVACRDCGRTVGRGARRGRRSPPTLCLTCLARHPEAGLGERLRSYRLAAGLTREALSERTGIAGHCLSSYERGWSEPPWHVLVRLVGVLGLGLVGA